MLWVLLWVVGNDYSFVSFFNSISFKCWGTQQSKPGFDFIIITIQQKKWSLYWQSFSNLFIIVYYLLNISKIYSLLHNSEVNYCQGLYSGNHSAYCSCMLRVNSIHPNLKLDGSTAALRHPAPSENLFLYPALHATEHSRHKAALRRTLILAAKQWYFGYLAASPLCLKTICWCFPFLTIKSQLIIWKQGMFF